MTRIRTVYILIRPLEGTGWSGFTLVAKYKRNNSLVLDKIYINNINLCINETINNNVCNPNTMWEIIKGNIRNY